MDVVMVQESSKLGRLGANVVDGYHNVIQFLIIGG